jgi:hypothetical protein
MARCLMLLGLIAVACREPPPPRLPRELPPETGTQRTRAAVATIQFHAGELTPGTGSDRLRVSVVFADVDRRDEPLLASLAGSHPPQPLPGLDACVRAAGPHPPAPPVRPKAWLQLLDVGNVALLAGSARLPLRVQLMPALADAVRGVRYDAELTLARAWLASGALRLQASGGDGVDAFEAAVPVPRPIHLGAVNAQPVRAGRVQAPVADGLELRWGSTLGEGVVELDLGADVPGGLGWLRCRMRDDGNFIVPVDLLQALPPRTPERPWLARITRSSEAAIPGFAGQTLRLELQDAVYVQ